MTVERRQAHLQSGPYEAVRGSSERTQVLLVDRDPACATLRNRWLQEGGCDVVHVGHGDGDIERLRWLQKLDVIVCDVHPASPDQMALLQRCIAAHPDVPVLFLADAPGSAPHHALAPSPKTHDTLLNPFGPAKLVTRVRRLVAMGRRTGGWMSRTILAIGAHPDDIEIGVGATLLRHAAANDRIVHLLMTDGEAGGIKEERVAEAEHSAGYLSATLVRAGLPDAFLSETRSTVAVIEQAVAAYHPAVVYVHSAHDAHPDHRFTHHAATVAAREIPEVYCYQSPSSTVAFAPNRFVEIGDYLDRKVEMLRVYQSQVRIREYLTEEVIRATARYWGRHAGHRVVEPLEVVRQVTSTCFASS